jgi:hypothetical protein
MMFLIEFEVKGQRFFSVRDTISHIWTTHGRMMFPIEFEVKGQRSSALDIEVEICFLPVRIRVRIGPPHPLVCCKRRLNGAVLRMRPEKPRPRVTAGVAR